MEAAESPSLSELYRPSMEIEDHREHREFGQCEAISGIDVSVLVGASVVKALAVRDDRDAHARGSSAASDLRSTAKRKRGRPPGSHRKGGARKEEDGEDVCFICFDGGNLVLCDRRGCPKAYHPACIKRDEAFFRCRALWNCGWHICSICEKASHYMCYTCTYSVCRRCVKHSEILCVRSNMGLCATCMKTVLLMENCDQQTKEMVDFDDKGSWEYLFKVYWTYLKDKMSLTVDELRGAWKPCSGGSNAESKGQNLPVLGAAAERENYAFGNSLKSVNTSKSKGANRQACFVENSVKSGVHPDEGANWTSECLLEFISHVKNGDTSPLSPLAVQSLLLEYIAKNNLHDPCLKSQVICDQRLRKLFGCARVCHFEMLKLLESHFPMQKSSQLINGPQGVEVTINQDRDSRTVDNQMIVRKCNKHKSRKKGTRNGVQTNLDTYAAIDVHNINLIYLKRSMMENLVEDVSEIGEKVLGAIVRIRLSDNREKQAYRLVQVIGIHKVVVPYKVGRGMTDIVLEVLNLDKKEIISIDSISNQMFSEEECCRYRQSIKCGIVKRLTIGEIQNKAKSLWAVNWKNWVESETTRLCHLLDRASELGHKKELREYLEKLESLKASQEQLHEIPEVHADQTMDTGYDSGEDVDNKKQGEVGTRVSYSLCNNGSLKISHSRDCNAANPETEVHENSFSGRNGCTNDRSNEQVDRTCSVAGTVSSAENVKNEKLWNYEDPHGRVQGPFSMAQLRKWSTTGYFPPDLMIWRGNGRREVVILLTDALKMQQDSHIHGQAEAENTCISGDNCGDEWSCESIKTTEADDKQVERDNSSTSDPKDVCTGVPQVGSSCNGLDNAVHPIQDRAENHGERSELVCEKEEREAIEVANMNERQNEEVTSNCCSSSAQYWRPELLSSSTSSTNLKLSMSSEPNNAIDFFNLPSPTPKTSDNVENMSLDLQNGRAQDSNPSCSTVGSATRLPDAAAEWSGYSPTPAEPSPEEQGFSMSSVCLSKALNAENDLAATPTSSILHLHQPALCWQAIGAEGSNFAPLAEESVSDLLAEADAMDSPKGLPSPSSILKDDSLDSLEVLSGFNTGKDDTLSLSCELRISFQPTPNIMLVDLNHSNGESGFPNH